MGQYWQFVNIDKRQSTGHLGKMGELFFSGSPRQLIYLLAIPAVPLKNASSDPTTKKDVAGGWAGDRIICLGDYANSWPDGVVSAVDFSDPPSPGASQDIWSEDGYGDYISNDDEENPQVFARSCRTVRNVDLGDEVWAAYPNDRVWVLRNITKKLYVRSNGIPTVNNENRLTYNGHHGLKGFPGLGNVLVANIGWSQDSSTSMWYSRSGKLAEGNWAGNRIDVRLMDDIVEDMAKEGWTDISRQEAITMYHVWYECGDGEGDLPDEPNAE
jgi:hypothetical protein